MKKQTITPNEAKAIMEKFLKTHSGQKVFFHALRNDEKFAYVLCDQFNYFDFLNAKARMERAINNTISHCDSGYSAYKAMDCMTIERR